MFRFLGDDVVDVKCEDCKYFIRVAIDFCSFFFIYRWWGKWFLLIIVGLISSDDCGIGKIENCFFLYRSFLLGYPARSVDHWFINNF